MSDRSYEEGDAPIYEEAVDEYLALVNGPTRVIGNGSISPPVDEDPTDLIAVVRRGVESGTIKGGKVRNLCREHHARYNDGAPGCEVWMAVKQGGGEPGPCQVEPFILIPVSDGGSET